MCLDRGMHHIFYYESLQPITATYKQYQLLNLTNGGVTAMIVNRPRQEETEKIQYGPTLEG